MAKVNLKQVKSSALKNTYVVGGGGGDVPAGVVDAIAGQFDEDTEYKTDDHVWYEGVLYRFENDHSGDWDENDVEAAVITRDIIDSFAYVRNELNTLNMFMSFAAGSLADIRGALAREFDSSASYSAGNYVMFDSILYRFTSAHSGEWTGEDVEQVVLTDEIS